jgi:hypothetical protein
MASTAKHDKDMITKLVNASQILPHMNLQHRQQCRTKKHMKNVCEKAFCANVLYTLFFLEELLFLLLFLFHFHSRLLCWRFNLQHRRSLHSLDA